MAKALTSKETGTMTLTPRLALVAVVAAMAIFAANARADDPTPRDCAGSPLAAGGFGVAPGCFDASIARAPADPLAGEEDFSEAAGHPYSITTRIVFNTKLRTSLTLGEEVAWPYEPAKDALVDAPPGMVADPTVAATCQASLLLVEEGNSETGPGCPPASQVGIANVEVEGALTNPIPVFNMVAPVGVSARLAFNVTGSIVVLDARLRSGSDNGFSIDVRYINMGVAVTGSKLTLWGVPADSSHDAERSCAGRNSPPGGPSCGAETAPRPFLRLPTSCPEPGQGLSWALHTDSWWHPGAFAADGEPLTGDPNWKTASFVSHDPPGIEAEPADPEGWGSPRGPEGCSKVPFHPALTTAKPTALEASTPTGLNVSVDVPNPGLENPDGISSADIKRAVVTLPEGLTINPSQADGLGVCTPVQYAQEALHASPQEGCPSDSTIGTVEVRTPLLTEALEGTVYIAKPFDNPFDSLLALYIVIESRQRGLIVKLPGKVEPNPQTGQIVTTFDDLPQVPVSKFTFQFRQGARAPLVTPARCGTYTTEAEFVPWSAEHPDNPTPGDIRHSSSSFEITRGIGGEACPSDAPPFHPNLIAGTLNNAAGAFSPFYLRLLRTDAEQEMTRFSIKLPPGVVAKLAGVSFCPDAAIQAAKERTGSYGGTEEIEHPSCPAASEVGHTLVGAGVGSVLAYAPGKLYLAGPYHGSAISLVAITAAKVGPFDLGTVVIRQAFKVDPETGEVFIDATGSDPIPHIIQGVPTHLRDIRVYTDRPEFVLNPTDCTRTSTASTVLGSGIDFSSEADDRPITVSSPFQAADCAALPFGPKLSLGAKGATNRGAHPALTATLRMGGFGEAGIKRAQVTLPASEFVENEHFQTICTRLQFKEGSTPGERCPPGSIYGHATVITPILSEALEGPVLLRSDPERQLPDVVANLHSGEIDVILVGHVDSVKGKLRTTFEDTPDAPVSEVIFSLLGQKKGLFVNQESLCGKAHRAIVSFGGHNGKARSFRPVLRARCGRQKRAGRRGR